MQASTHSPTHFSLVQQAASPRLWLVTLTLVWSATWALSHGYQGIHHDASLYTLQALARLHPSSLTRDVFLRFGSQDDFTIFGSLYATAIRWLGLEPAAAILTLASQLGLVVGGAVLARRTCPTPLALFGVSVMLAIPGFYGGDRVFSVIEPFVTPRMAAEALTLFGLSAALSSRPRLAFALVVLGMLVHPVMAMAGLVALAIFYVVAIRRPLPAAVLLGGGTLALVCIARLPQATFDSEWLALIRGRSPYVFLGNWSLDDWGRAAVPLATLVVGLRSLTQQTARTLCLLALLTASAGLLLSLVAADGLHLVVVTQLQPWRWQWLALVVAAVLLPAIAAAGWARPSNGQVTTLLLIAAWACEAGELALFTSGAALASLALARWSTRREMRLVLGGAAGVLLVVVLDRLANSLLLTDSHYFDPQIPAWIRATTSFVSNGCVPIALTLVTVWLSGNPRTTPLLALLAVVLLALCTALFPDAWRRWSQQQFPPTLVAQFAPWRELVPPGSDIWWSEASLSSWTLLERPSYISVAQTSGMLFSRNAALELERRANALAQVVPPRSYLGFSGTGAGIGPSPQQLVRACATSEFEFLVTGAKLSWPALAELPATVWHSSGGLRLYRCP